jgi:hypothetical protein
VGDIGQQAAIFVLLKQQLLAAPSPGDPTLARATTLCLPVHDTCTSLE